MTFGPVSAARARRTVAWSEQLERNPQGVIMQTALVATWTHPIVGREQKALAFAAEVNEFWSAKAAAGLCSEPQWFFAESGIGMWIVTGERDALMQIHDSEEAMMLLIKGELFAEAFRVEFFFTGDSAAEFMNRFGAALASLA